MLAKINNQNIKNNPMLLQIIRICIIVSAYG